MSKLTDILTGAGLTGEAVQEAERAILESYRSREETEAKAERIKSLEAEVADYREQVAKLSDTSETDELREKVAAYEKADEERRAAEAERQAREEFREGFDRAVGGRRFANDRTERSVFEDAFKEHVEHPGRSTEEIVDELTGGDGIFANPQRQTVGAALPVDGEGRSADDIEQRQFIASLFHNSTDKE